MKQIVTLFFAFSLSSNVFAQSELFISEYVEGSGAGLNNKAIEIFNPTDSAIDVRTYSIRRYSNGSPTATEEEKLEYDNNPTTTLLQPYKAFVYINPTANFSSVLNAWDSGNGGQKSADYSSTESTVIIKGGACYHNGNDALALVKYTSANPTGLIIDIFGQIGYNPGNGSSPSPGWTGFNWDTVYYKLTASKNAVYDSVDMDTILNVGTPSTDINGDTTRYFYFNNDSTKLIQWSSDSVIYNDTFNINSFTYAKRYLGSMNYSLKRKCNIISGRSTNDTFRIYQEWEAYGNAYEDLNGDGDKFDDQDMSDLGFHSLCATNTGIAENIDELALKVKVYPNPATNFVQIEVKDIRIKNLAIFNFNGQYIKPLQKTVLFNETISFDLSNVEKGLYFVEIISEKGAKIYKELILN